MSRALDRGWRQPSALMCRSALAAGVAIVVIAVLEIVVRSVGLGSYALSVTHPTIEYMFAPNQDIRWFGNVVHINAFGMRSPDISMKRGSADPKRTLVMGDSVVNGGNQTDQGALATTLLSNRGRLALNASAGSWGPPNELAYVKTFGFFGADRVIIVVSSADAFDVPSFAPLNPLTHPTKNPTWATLYAAQRYLPYLFAKNGPVSPAPEAGPKSALPAFRELVQMSKLQGTTCVILHAAHGEIAGKSLTGHDDLLGVAEAENVTVVEDKPFMNPALDYRDGIHINSQGQAHLAAAMRRCSPLSDGNF